LNDDADMRRASAQNGEFVKKRLTALLLVVGLAACGGGGGGSSIGATVPVPTPTPQVASLAVQRALVQQTLSSTQQGSSIASFGSPSSTLAIARRAASGERFAKAASLSACSNQTRSSVTQPSSTVIVLVVNGYYDTACTLIEVAINLTVTVTSSTTATAVGNTTTYTTSGAVSGYDALSLTIGGLGTANETFSARDDLSASATATPFANIGVGCSVTKTSDACSLAEALHVASLNADQAAAATVSGTVTATQSGITTVAISGTGTSSAGALNATNIAPSGAYLWSTTGGSLVDNVSIIGSLQFNSVGRVVGGSIAVTDSASNAAATAAYAPTSGALSGTVSSLVPTAQLATFTVSATGSGTVTYANGTTAPITNWAVQG